MCNGKNEEAASEYPLSFEVFWFILQMVCGLVGLSIAVAAWDINIDAILALPWWRAIVGSIFMVGGVYCITSAFEDDDK